MGLFPDSPVPPLVTITPWSMESIGGGLQTIGNTIGNSTGSAAWPSANAAIFVPFWVFTTTTFLRMFLYHGSGAAGNVDMGVYDAAGTRLMSLGSTAQSGTSQVKTYNTTDLTLPPGKYYMALALSSTSGTVAGTGAITTPQQKLLGCYQMASAFPLPATATFATLATFLRIPFFGLHTSDTL